MDLLLLYLLIDRKVVPYGTQLIGLCERGWLLLDERHRELLELEVIVADSVCLLADLLFDLAQLLAL